MAARTTPRMRGHRRRLAAEARTGAFIRGVTAMKILRTHSRSRIDLGLAARPGLLAAALVLWAAGVGLAGACSDVILDPAKTGPDQVVSARTMDLPGVYELGTEWVSVPRGVQWKSQSPNFTDSLQWQVQYGFVGLDFLGNSSDLLFKRRFFFDGMNERGLSAAWLWLEDAEFPTMAEADYPQALMHLDVVAWILSQYDNVPDVATALRGAKVWQFSFVGFDFPPLHLVVHDAAGRTLIAEWFREPSAEPTLHIYDGEQVDTVGVMTNEPTYWQQLQYLAGFGGLTPNDGLEGLPGGTYPSARFVRLAKLREHMRPLESPLGGVALAVHIIDSVDVVRGTDYEADMPPYYWDETGVSLVRDHSKRRIYFKGLYSPSLRLIDLARIDFAAVPHIGTAYTELPADINPKELAHFAVAEDVTAQLAAPAFKYVVQGGSKYIERLDLRVNVATVDANQTARMYIWARDADGRLLSWRPSAGWTEVQSGSLLPCFTGRLVSRTFGNVLVNAKMADYEGMRIYAGYGRSPAEMLIEGDYAQVFMVLGEDMVNVAPEE